ncbi:MAG: hypothetical protein J0L64_01755 [Acidobacteria bacterium]|nr:hypothetical protein [Acidobacteriota bacterium]
MKGNWAMAAGAAILLAGCGGNKENPMITGQPVNGSAPGGATVSTAFAGSAGSGAGVDGSAATSGEYIIMNRVRFLDQQGFDQPVEAFSMLFPKDWRTEGGIVWGNVGGCRGEFTRSQVKATSPDGKFQFEAPLSRAFQWADDPMMRQSLQAGAQAGGCQLNQPFNAQQFIEGYARQDLRAEASNVRLDENRMQLARVLDQQANSISRQSGGQSSQETTMALGDLRWPDGSEGIMVATVTNMILRSPNYMGGGATTMSSTSATPFLMRCPAGRRAECSQWMNLFMTSHRVNPIWREAKDRFLTQLGQIEHAGRMERIRLMGEQSRAYARAQSDASDQRMRDWENRQASQDASQKRFIQTIREVETWRDASGAVELSSGYANAWSRGDGSYLLTNKPGFDPNSAFREQRWTQMRREQ